MPYINLRLYRAVPYLTALPEPRESPLHLGKHCVGHLMDELAIREGEHNERPEKIDVTFSQATKEGDARLAYTGRWTDPSSNHIYPGTLELHLPLDESIESFISVHDFDAQYLILTLYLEDRDRAILSMGSGEDQDKLWDSSIASSLPAKIICLGGDTEKRPEVEPVEVETPKPLPWQAEAIANLGQAQREQIEVANELKRQLGAIKVILVALAVGIFTLIVRQ